MSDLEERVQQLERTIETLRREFTDLRQKVSHELERCIDAATRGTFTLIDRVEKLEQELSKLG